MTKKRILLGVGCAAAIVALLAGGFLLFRWYAEQRTVDEYPPFVMVNGSLYQQQDRQPYSIPAEEQERYGYAEIGRIQKTVPQTQLPDTDFASNFGEPGSVVYQSKDKKHVYVQTDAGLQRCDLLEEETLAPYLQAPEPYRKNEKS